MADQPLQGTTEKKALSLFDLELAETVTNKGELIAIWLDILAKNPNIWGVDSHAAIRDLKNLYILNNAYITYIFNYRFCRDNS
jgi:hypothetical protein